MPAEASQNYSSHRRWYPLYHFVALPILMGNFFFTAWRAFQVPNKDSIWQAVVALGIALVGWTGRAMALRVQNRLIRLEMQLRFARILPAELAARAGALTPRQLVSLRFASDAELPALIERCLSGELSGGDDLKKEIKDWQADWLRA